jgi:feruloyl esterase
MLRLQARKHLRPLPLLLPLVVLLAVAVAAPAAEADCTVAALSALGVANVTILSATDVAAAAPNPAFCSVVAAVTTSGFGAGDGSALAVINLPANWNGKFLFFGTGGLAGVPSPSANGVDVGLSLQKGYATAVTDTGHTGHGPDGIGIVTDASWSITAPGVPDTPKVVDYYFRAVHDVTVAGKQLVKAFFNAPRIARAYFDGCSNGGRMAFVQATRFPDDYDGIVAGAPFLDIRVVLGGVGKAKALLTPASYIPFIQLPLVDQAVYASCDATDGVVDNLIQNPAACAFDPDTLVPGTLSQPQADALKVYLGATRDQRGRLLYPGFAVSDLHGFGMDLWTTGFVPPFDFGAAEPWGDSGFSPAPIGFQFVDHIIKFLIERDPTFDVHTFGVSAEGVVSPAALALFDARTEAGDGDVPEKLLSFIAKGRKMLVYHGYSDPALPPFRTVKYYEDLADLIPGNFQRLQDSVRLFMVPGMQHCGGGPGPNVFDTLTPLEQWVEHGVAPESIPAAHFVNNNPTLGVDRTMPLCKFPEQAAYRGRGSVNDAANWSCTPNRRLLRVGPSGVDAGLGGAGHDDD